MPHIKSLLSISTKNDESSNTEKKNENFGSVTIDRLYYGSHNMSMAAFGFQYGKDKIKINNYEAGILIIGNEKKKIVQAPFPMRKSPCIEEIDLHDSDRHYCHFFEIPIPFLLPVEWKIDDDRTELQFTRSAAKFETIFCQERLQANVPDIWGNTMS